jgi:hypothetical protein
MSRVTSAKMEILMTDPLSQKKKTQKVVISDPDEELLEIKLEGRALSPELSIFLKSLVKTKKWTKNITIPSGHDNVAVVLLFTGNLKEVGLEILSEIHVFYEGKVFIEVWEVLPETAHPTTLPTGIFSSVNVERVLVSGSLIYVEMKVYLADGAKKRILKTYDFSNEEPTAQTRELADGEAMLE